MLLVGFASLSFCHFLGFGFSLEDRGKNNTLESNPIDPRCNKKSMHIAISEQRRKNITESYIATKANDGRLVLLLHCVSGCRRCVPLNQSSCDCFKLQESGVANSATRLHKSVGDTRFQLRERPF